MGCRQLLARSVDTQGKPTSTPRAHTHRLSLSSGVSLGVPRDRRLCSKEVTARRKDKRKEQEGLPQEVSRLQQRRGGRGEDGETTQRTRDNRCRSPAPPPAGPPRQGPPPFRHRPLGPCGRKGSWELPPAASAWVWGCPSSRPGTLSLGPDGAQGSGQTATLPTECGEPPVSPLPPCPALVPHRLQEPIRTRPGLAP